MNLAEIRRKAGESRVADGKGISPSPEQESQAEDLPELGPDENFQDGFDSFEPFGEEPILDLLPEFEEFGEPFSDALPEPVEPLMPEPAAPPSMQAPLAVSPAFAEQSAPQVSAPVETVKDSHGDPLARLLAGRESSANAYDQFESTPSAAYDDDVEEYLCFRVAEEEYALSILAIKEIIKPREVTEVPRMPGFIPGVISLRGVIIPIMDMRLRLSLPLGAETGRERIIVLKTAAGSCGVLVDEVIQVVRIQSSAVEPPPAVLDGIDKEFVKGLGRYDNRMLILLNLTSILDLEIH